MNTTRTLNFLSFLGLLLGTFFLFAPHIGFADNARGHQDDNRSHRFSKGEERSSKHAKPDKPQQKVIIRKNSDRHSDQHSHKLIEREQSKRTDSHYHRIYFDQDRHKHPDQYRRDERYDHRHYYPRPGHTVRTLPHYHKRIHYHNRDYFYFSGVWYLGNGVSFKVVTPPLGIIVHTLPVYYTTLWVDGIPYYYANDSYYVWRSERKGYEVVKRPEAIDNQQPTELVDELFIYPKEGQSEQQQADDRFACHQWSAKQSHFDPSLPPENLTKQELNRYRLAYQRAMRACLEGRGYSVR